VQTDQLQALRKEKYISLTTCRRDGRAVATSVWFAIDGDPPGVAFSWAFVLDPIDERTTRVQVRTRAT
jgi:hypothetical protein